MKLERLRNTIWTTKDGKKIKIKDMEISHIKNCINMLNRSSNPREMNCNIINMIKIFEIELKIRDSQNKLLDSLLDEAWNDCIR